MEKVKRNRRTLQLVLVIVCVAVVASGIMLVTGMKSGSGASAAGNSAASLQDKNVKDTSAQAKKLFEAKPADSGDSKAVAKLLETMGFEDTDGEFSVNIRQSGKKSTLTISVSSAVNVDDKSSFDDRMMKYGEQMLALIPDVNEVVWEYSVTGGGGETKTKGTDEAATVTLDEAGAKDVLGRDVKTFGESASAVKELLDLQNKQ